MRRSVVLCIALAWLVPAWAGATDPGPVNPKGPAEKTDGSGGLSAPRGEPRKTDGSGGMSAPRPVGPNATDGSGGMSTPKVVGVKGPVELADGRKLFVAQKGGRLVASWREDLTGAPPVDGQYAAKSGRKLSLRGGVVERVLERSGAVLDVSGLSPADW